MAQELGHDIRRPVQHAQRRQRGRPDARLPIAARMTRFGDGTFGSGTFGEPVPVDYGPTFPPVTQGGPPWWSKYVDLVVELGVGTHTGNVTVAQWDGARWDNAA